MELIATLIGFCLLSLSLQSDQFNPIFPVDVNALRQRFQQLSSSTSSGPEVISLARSDSDGTFLFDRPLTVSIIPSLSFVPHDARLPRIQSNSSISYHDYTLATIQENVSPINEEPTPESSDMPLENEIASLLDITDSFMALVRIRNPVFRARVTFEINRQDAFGSFVSEISAKGIHTTNVGGVKIKFSNEIGLDYMGLKREFFSLVANELFAPNGRYSSLFFHQDSGLFLPSPREDIDDSLYFYAGIFVGWALQSLIPLNVYFAPSMYKLMLHQGYGSVDLDDFSEFDPIFHESLQKILIATESELKLMDLEFVYTHKILGDIGLQTDAGHVQVTVANRAEYVHAIVQHLMIDSIRDRLDSFLQGFFSVFSNFSVSLQTLKLILHGAEVIDLDDWSLNTQIKFDHLTDETGLTSLQVVEWFWAAIRTLSDSELSLFFRYATGLPNVPFGGFKQFRPIFSIEVSSVIPIDNMPFASTCFFKILLPQYTSFEHTQQKINQLLEQISTQEGLNFHVA